ncbi:MAG TPA: cupredoxin domain-containing protein [Candidatus Angelobacter sp.]|nr:cupredoxin domain-containing protein [Candidatus Angelobacter sp.]
MFCGFSALIGGCKGEQQTGPTEHISVVMKKYSIEPAVIRVKSGSNVDLLVTTADVQHGFDVPQLGIKESVQPGRPTHVKFKAPAKGEYGVTCGIICGPHHDDMQAKLVVE